MLNPNKPTTSERDTRASSEDVDQPSLIDLVMAVSHFEPQHCCSTRNHHTSSTPPQLLEILDAVLILIAEDDYPMNQTMNESNSAAPSRIEDPRQ
jgi:hypothetical protein